MKSNCTIAAKGVHLAGALALAILIGACSAEKRSSVLYYPVDSLITSQVNELARQKASVKKTVIIGDDESVSKFVPDSAGWVRELEIFRSIDQINKPINRGLYLAEELTEAGYRILSLQSNEDELAVKKLKVFFEAGTEKVRKLEAEFEESYSMYHGSRRLFMEFDTASILKRYTVEGKQKMILADSVGFSIKGDVALSRD